ncbi:MAG: methionyl-tRNA formyltransferase [Rhodospirillaceae bacterium]|nr:methionyl-tRNA formyltransferase [Rhodospirillaceae bacterium]
MALSLAFMGSPDFSVPALTALYDAGHKISAVYCQPPRPAGRGQNEQPCPVDAVAHQFGFPVFTPSTLRDDSTCQDFTDLNLDVAVVAAYGLIVPKAILQAPRLGCINIHASLLPRWRGAAPIQRAILAGDSESGITIMQMEEGLDTGPMLLSGKVPITSATTGETLHDSLSVLGSSLILDALAGLQEKTITATPQPNEGITYAKKLNQTESILDWQKPAQNLERQIRAFIPWPGSWFQHNGERIKVLAASQAENTGSPGTVVDNQLTIACGDGSLRPLTLQRAGKRAMPAEEFLRGWPIPAGTKLP